MLRTFVDGGGKHIDTAASYSEGGAEAMIGSLLGDVVSRTEVSISTKAGTSTSDGRRSVDTSRSAMLSALDASLARLGTDYVDVWFAQAWDGNVPLDETLSALEFAVRSGRARYAGICQLQRLAERQSSRDGRVSARRRTGRVLPAPAETGSGTGPRRRGRRPGPDGLGSPGPRGPRRANTAAASRRIPGPHAAIPRPTWSPIWSSSRRSVVEAVAMAAQGPGPDTAGCVAELAAGTARRGHRHRGPPDAGPS